MKQIPLHNLDDAARRLMARAVDLIRREAYDVAYSHYFLTPREQRLFLAAAQAEGAADRRFFYGGAAEAERRTAVLSPDWLLGDVPGGDPFGPEREAFLFSLLEDGVIDLSEAIVPLALNGSPYGDLSHRDWLGSLLALGIDRTALGDIDVLDPHHAVAFFTPSVAPYIADHLVSAGSDTVSAVPADLPHGFAVPRSFESVEASVASPRLDGVVRALTNLSRADAAALVKAGDIELNYFCEENLDAPVDDGDILSIRGYGKYIIDSANTVTRRGRNRLVARKYK